MYEFVRGPLVWVALIVFFGASLFRVVTMTLAVRKEKSVYPTMSAKFGLRSIGHWLMPFGTHNMRRRPVFTIISFLFHVCLLITPLFVMGHAVLWEQGWGISWWSLPPWAADAMSLIVVFGALFFLLRRFTAPEVRNVSALSDFLLVILVASPFLTGFVAHHQWLEARAMLTVHIICGAGWLIAVPFTRLSHMLWFVFTRAFMGSEFGSVRNARDY